MALALLVRAWAMHPLYIHGKTRHRVQTVIEGTAAREGWLLSDMSLQLVAGSVVHVLHHAHIRGEDQIRCYYLNIYNGSLRPCLH